jgi:hypothetical protein
MPDLAHGGLVCISDTPIVKILICCDGGCHGRKSGYFYWSAYNAATGKFIDFADKGIGEAGIRRAVKKYFPGVMIEKLEFMPELSPSLK